MENKTHKMTKSIKGTPTRGRKWNISSAVNQLEKLAKHKPKNIAIVGNYILVCYESNIIGNKTLGLIDYLLKSTKMVLKKTTQDEIINYRKQKTQ